MNAASGIGASAGVLPHWPLWVTASVALIVTAATIWLMLASRWPLALDQPNDRSLHSSPVPRTGGVGVLAGLMCASRGGDRKSVV